MAAAEQSRFSAASRKLRWNARAVADHMDAFKARAMTLREGHKSELLILIDSNSAPASAVKTIAGAGKTQIARGVSIALFLRRVL